MAFITKILPQVINVAKKINNPITSKITDAAANATSSPTQTTSRTELPPGFRYDKDGFVVADVTSQTDLRIKISMPAMAPSIFYRDRDNLLLAPLEKTQGFVFPIQPDITISHSAEYQTTKPTHSNFPYYHYTNSEIQQISLTGDFPIRSVYDARYVNAGITFLRSCTRMFNSKDDELAGYPPMVLRLYGLGYAGFDDLPVVVTSVNVSYPNAVDFITFKPFERLNETAKMPTSLTIQVSLNPVFSRDYITNTYSTLNFSKGAGLLGYNRPIDKLTPSTISKPIDIPNVTLETPPQISTETKLQADYRTQQEYNFIAEQGGGSAADYGYTPTTDPALNYVIGIQNLPPPPPQQPNATTSGPKPAGSTGG